jgi:tetratricopeptide (TPR) repeat protein/tRNA A-37 threonylcarbamoyl transferase component Bud32
VTQDLLPRLEAALQDRYRIERPLGAGGMATVYLARDPKHEREVAVKVLRPELAAALGPERFHQEIKIAAHLNHPHVLPLLDSGEADGFLYYVMPHVEGESLREKLAREGELPVAEAVRILRDVVDALSHAHKHGVVHRDIKPDNILLSERHALVTDFGVAKAVSEATGVHKLTTEGVALGTPAYMSPEQAAADKHIDHRADIYAVGAVAYELLTGRPPFTGTTQQEILAAHVTQAVEPVMKYRDTVPTALAELVMKCLAKKPADRWQSAEELLPQLEALATPSGGTTPVGTVPVSAMARTKNVAVATTAIAVVLAAILVVMLLPRGGSAALDTRRVVVAPFSNLTSEDSLNTHGRVAASWITRGLQQISELSVVPWVAVQQEVNAIGGGNLVRELAELTRAGIVVSGSYSRQGDSLRFQTEITDPRRVEVLNTVPLVNGSLANLETAFQELAERIAGALSVVLDTVFAATASFGSHEPTYAAFREHVRGSDLHSRGRYDEALEHFLRGYELDTAYVANLAWAAIALWNCGRYAEADSLLEIGGRLRHLMAKHEQQAADWFRAELAGNLHEASRISGEVADENPGWTTMVFQSAASAIRVNRPQGGIELLESIDPTRGWMKEWVPYWGYLTSARHMLGDFRRELRDARSARELHPDRLPVYRYEISALAALGREDEARSLLDDLLRLPPDPSWGHAREAAVAGLEFRAHGHPNAAREALNLALERLQSHTPDSASRITYRFHLAEILYWNERWEQAHAEFSQLSFEDPDDPNFKGYFGVTSARLGNVDDASRISDELAALDRPYVFGSHTRWRARIAALLGDKEQAVELLRQAFNEGAGYDISLHRDIDLESLRDNSEFQEFVRPKG